MIIGKYAYEEKNLEIIIMYWVVWESKSLLIKGSISN